MTPRMGITTGRSRLRLIAGGLLTWLSISAATGLTAAQPANIPDNGSPAELPALTNGDYGVDTESWNGLFTLTAIAKGMGMTVEAVTDIHWNDLGAGDILLVLYPRTRLEPGHMAGFVRSGGHLLVADDFGRSNEALARLGMLREPAIGVHATRFYQNHGFAPVATPLLPDHPLAAGVTEIITNHPAVLTQVNGPEIVFGFGPGEGVVVAGTLGGGRFVALSDPSILINRMLQFEGNMQLVINLLQYLSHDGRATRLVLLVGDFSFYGEPRGLLDDGTVRGAVGNMAGDLNRWLDERNDYLLTQPGMKAVAVIVAALIALLALLTLPVAKRAQLEGAWTRARSDSLPAESFEDLVQRYDRQGQNANYLLPATVLRDTANRLIAGVLDEPDPLFTGREEIVCAELRERVGPQAEMALHHVFKRLKSLPSRAQAASLWSTGQLSRRDFERLRDDVEALYLALGREPR